MLFQFQQTGTTKLIIIMTEIHSLKENICGDVVIPLPFFNTFYLDFFRCFEVLSVLLFLFPLTKLYLIKYLILCQS